MSSFGSKQPVLPSLLDRLIARDESSAPTLRDLKAAVRRDLENLLNTRRRCLGWPATMEELNNSLFNYGLPDFVGMNLAAGPNREQFRKEIEKAIKIFETRLQNVRVILTRNPNPLDRTLRFRIDAALIADPYPEPVSFNSSMEPVSATFTVERAPR